MSVILLIAIMIAFANTRWRSQIYDIIITILAFSGFLNDYVIARYLKFYGATDWRFSALVSALALLVYYTAACVFEVYIA